MDFGTGRTKETSCAECSNMFPCASLIDERSSVRTKGSTLPRQAVILVHVLSVEFGHTWP